MKKRLPLLFLFSFAFTFLAAQKLVVDRTFVDTDSIPLSFGERYDFYDGFRKYKDIEIHCRNAGNATLSIKEIDRGYPLKVDTNWNWMPAVFPASIAPGATGIVHLRVYIDSYEKQFFRINSNGGNQTIAATQHYKPVVTAHQDVKFIPAKENAVAVFHLDIQNNGPTWIRIDSIATKDNRMKLTTPLRKIAPAETAHLDLEWFPLGEKAQYGPGKVLVYFHDAKNNPDYADALLVCALKPNIQFLSGDTFHFGRVDRGTVVHASFKMKNLGTVVLSTESWCGNYSCSKKTIDPSDTFTVAIDYHTDFADSGISTMHYVLPFPPISSCSFFVSGFVAGPDVKKDPLAPEVYSIDLGTFKAGQGGRINYNIHYTNHSNEPITISSGVTSDGGSMVEYPKEPIKPGETVVVMFVQDLYMPRHFERPVSIAYFVGNDFSRSYSVVMKISGTIE